MQLFNEISVKKIYKNLCQHYKRIVRFLNYKSRVIQNLRKKKKQYNKVWILKTQFFGITSIFES